MDLWKHFLASTILILLLYHFLGISSFLIYVTGFFIDIDHVLYYTLKNKKFSLKKTYRFFKNLKLGEHRVIFRVFHSLEMLIVLLIIFLFYPETLALIYGFLLHLIMDILHEKSMLSHLSSFSIIYYLKTKTLIK